MRVAGAELAMVVAEPATSPLSVALTSMLRPAFSSLHTAAALAAGPDPQAAIAYLLFARAAISDALTAAAALRSE